MTIITVRMTITIIRLKQKHSNKTLIKRRFVLVNSFLFVLLLFLCRTWHSKTNNKESLLLFSFLRGGILLEEIKFLGSRLIK